MRPAVKADGSKYYEYVLCYVDDILVVLEWPKRIMEGLEAKYMLKAGSVGEPTMYLGAKVSKYQLEHSDNPDKVPWSLSGEDYVNRAVKDVETELEKLARHCQPMSQLLRRWTTIHSWISPRSWDRNKPRTSPV
jgi:hypothetical protein